ncbi:hypothetical protein RZR97_10435 [Hydrogenimonas thermophila]|uniref:hypothetical protein n=1 Tax=Hydrogenimonas thermophila TaxID=223786 RepID=UPI0029370585|nr:hypothetical protein [Hydrogenimonas thermophila]WOE69516.1 hypothetical protein RZR91_10460 [Hydrogenimonas thermophila]WOE72027.1 hypothetical protein RZR97_10435 [Hydrogenimonas thermophila]
MTIKEAILKSLDDLKQASSHWDVYNNIKAQQYYDFKKAKTPESTISALLGDFIRTNDTRVKRIKGEGGTYLYYLSKYESDLTLENIQVSETRNNNNSDTKKRNSFQERDLHKLLSSYLKNQNIYSKTIFHEKSNGSEKNQKWIHPDMLGIKFLNLSSKTNQNFLKLLNKADTFKITSYELKKEINTDYELKEAYFQAVSNSSWANYGYLVAFEISDNLLDEIERLNQSFGIGVIELNANPYKSKILYPSKLKELDFKTIDKLCKINKDFENFIEYTEKILSVEDRFYNSVEKEFNQFCDKYFENDSDIEKYCKERHIPMESLDNKSLERNI